MLVLFVAFIASVSATFCTDLLALTNVTLSLPPNAFQTSLPVGIQTQADYVLWLQSTYNWAPNATVKASISLNLQAQWNLSIAQQLLIGTYISAGAECVNETIAATQLLFDAANIALNAAASSALTTLETTQAYIAGNFTAFNNLFNVHCQDVLAFEAYVEAFTAQVTQGAQNIATYVLAVTAQVEQDTLNALYAAQSLLEDPTNTTRLQIVFNRAEALIVTLQQVNRSKAGAVAWVNSLKNELVQIGVSYQSFKNGINTYESSWASFKASFPTGKTVSLTDQQIANMIVYFNANASFSVNFTTVQITLNGDTDSFSFSVQASVQGSASVSVKTTIFEDAVKRWLVTGYGFRCADLSTNKKRAIASGQDTDSIQVELLGSSGSGASSAVFCSLLLLTFASLFH